MSIWFGNPTVDEVNHIRRGSMAEHLGIDIVAIGEDWLEATMPVNEYSTQPFGILHGGASVALAETLASVAAFLCVDPDRQRVVGVDINASHLRSVPRGQTVRARAHPVHRGRTGQVWQVDIVNEAGQPVCSARMTARVLDHTPE